MNDLHPRNKDLLRHRSDLQPFEADSLYQRRLQALLPNFPPPVIEDWILRHGDAAFELFGWLDYRRFYFEAYQRLTTFLQHEVRTDNEAAVECWSKLLREDESFRRQSELGSYMLSRGTWPIPPILLDNSDGLVDPQGKPLGRHHLLEGHHRLAYLRSLAMPPAIETRPLHKVWSVRYEEPRGKR